MDKLFFLSCLYS